MRNLCVALMIGFSCFGQALAAPASLFLQVDSKFPPRVRARVAELLTKAGLNILSLPAEAGPAAVPVGATVLALGDTALARQALPDLALAPLGAEGFAIQSARAGAGRVIAARGNPADEPRNSRLKLPRGTLFATYALLERLGFVFAHPLAPGIPRGVSLPENLAVREKPRWPVRGLHLHTMHPLELTHVLNGWGPNGPDDAAGYRALVPEWERFCEWMLASRQNTVQWILLEDTSWAAWAQSSQRLERLKELVAIGQEHGLTVGIDVPIALAQQNAFRLINKPGTDAEAIQQMRERMAWLASAGFDLISTEMGFSEFHHPDDRQMVAWLDEFTRTAARLGMIATTKAHVSVGQTAEHYADPVTGKPINFNFLTHYCDRRLGVLVHTVQHYALDDPAPTYDRKDFHDLHQFLRQEVDERSTIWYPETAYWVSYDIDLPLFLPLYAERRVHDLRLLAAEEKGRKPMDGQMIFSSGWEWGYWLNDLVTARAAWNPHSEAPSDAEATVRILVDALGAGAEPLARALVALAADQHKLLTLGQFGATAPADVSKRNGQAYLQGWETWDDVSATAALIPGVPAIKTQPDKIGYFDVSGPLQGPRYQREIQPLLAAMEKAFARHSEAIARVAATVPAVLAPLAADVKDGARMLALRATQVFALYDRASKQGDDAWSAGRLAAARAALDEATQVTKAREAHYRVDADRIAGWGPNPTSYAFAYLWTARTLHFWWRDEGKVTQKPKSPCYLNVIHPAEVATAEGSQNSMYQRVQKIVAMLGPVARWVEECLVPPASPPNHRAIVRP